MNACSPRCGWCGRCEDDYDTRPPAMAFPVCDACGKDAFFPKTLAGVGIACSDKCMNKLCLQHEARMARQ